MSTKARFCRYNISLSIAAFVYEQVGVPKSKDTGIFMRTLPSSGEGCFGFSSEARGACMSFDSRQIPIAMFFDAGADLWTRPGDSGSHGAAHGLSRSAMVCYDLRVGTIGRPSLP